MAENTLWGIHAGRHAEADPLFLRENRVAIGWGEIGDLTKLRPTREAFKDEVARFWLKDKQQTTINWASQLYRFVHEMKTGDLVAYPSKIDHDIHLGRIAGNYEFIPNPNHMYENRRPVAWLGAHSRKQFSQGALYEIGSSLTLFRIKRYADEFCALINGKPAKEKHIVPESEDVTFAAGAEYFEETTRDYILERLAQTIKGYPFQDFIADLLRTMGYRTRISPVGTDQGIDIVARRDELELEPPIIRVQAKSGEGTIGDPQVSAFYAKVGNSDLGLFITIGTFSPQAKQFAKSKTNLKLIDGTNLVDLILGHYEQLDSRYKALIPLKKVYIPQAVDEQG
jgi:restriction system protein